MLKNKEKKKIATILNNAGALGYIGAILSTIITFVIIIWFVIWLGIKLLK